MQVKSSQLMILDPDFQIVTPSVRQMRGMEILLRSAL